MGVSRKRRAKKRVTKKRRKARKPVKKDTGNLKSVWEGKAKATRKGLTKRHLEMTKSGKIVVKAPKVGSRLMVFRGKCERTVGGLTKKDLMKNKRGKVISKKAYARGKKLMNKGLLKWSNLSCKREKSLTLKDSV